MRRKRIHYLQKKWPHTTNNCIVHKKNELKSTRKEPPTASCVGAQKKKKKVTRLVKIELMISFFEFLPMRLK